MKNLLTRLEKLNNEFDVDETILDALECNGKMLEFTEFLEILFLEMRSFFILLNPQSHTHLGLHKHNSFSELSYVPLDFPDDFIVLLVPEIKL